MFCKKDYSKLGMPYRFDFNINYEKCCKLTEWHPKTTIRNPEWSIKVIGAFKSFLGSSGHLTPQVNTSPPG